MGGGSILVGMRMCTGVRLWADFWSSVWKSYLASKAFLSAGSQGYHHHLPLCLHLPSYLLLTLFLGLLPRKCCTTELHGPAGLELYRVPNIDHGPVSQANRQLGRK